jgi:(1->4)-alpha-D-glucan 1-alpha-D-glucosylmutase
MKIPCATYRLQFTADFGFDAAAEVLPYLKALGVSDIYASPIFQARAGSRHGYDVVDPNRINPELGGEAGFAALSEAARRLGLGWVQDIVPNHMAYDGQNQLLMDVLENGEASRFRDFFDIDWQHPYESMRGKVLAPFLGAFYGECLENGEITLHYDEQGLSIRYFALRLPVNIESYGDVLTLDLAALRRRLGPQQSDYVKFVGVVYTLKNLAPKEESVERADQIRFVKQMLWELYSTTPAVRAHLDTNIARFNGVKGNPESFNLLDRLLAQQWYRLAFWKVAAEELDYRRFFNINELISLKIQDEKVFRGVHELILKLVAERKITGLRVDHVDGLYDPLTYLQRLRRQAGDVYLIVEKILGSDEALPADWPIQGTTGYEFLNYVNGIFCARAQRRRFNQIYERFTAVDAACPALMVEKKRLIIGKYMAGDIESLAFLLKRVSSRDRHAADVTLYGLKRALVEVLAYFPVYRSYVGPGVASAQDRRQLSEAVERAKSANAGLLLELNYIERFLLLDFADHMSEEEKSGWLDFVMRFQQLTAPLMAKGFEDTALYVYNRLLSLNDVGGDPDRFGVGLDEFHQFNQARLKRWPHALSATATHDTKRGEDARARINVLSELPEEWEKQLRLWNRLNRPHKTRIRGAEAPDRNDEYALYQALIGSYPFDGEATEVYLERLKAYLVKAVREAKVHTEWLKPDDAYEETFVNFATKILAPDDDNRFLQAFLPFAKRVAHAGAFNSLSQTLIKVAAPGVPDIYQGNELWDLSFVDPDNRRAVDFSRRREWLARVKEADAHDAVALLADLLEHWQDGRIKLHLLQKLMNFRAAHHELFTAGDYLPLSAAGESASMLCAFARRYDPAWVVAVAPRLIGALVYRGRSPLGAEAWAAGSLELPASAPRRWVDVITGNRFELSGNALALSELLRNFPGALLYADAGADEGRLMEANFDAAAPIQHL